MEALPRGQILLNQAPQKIFCSFVKSSNSHPCSRGDSFPVFEGVTSILELRAWPLSKTNQQSGLHPPHVVFQAQACPQSVSCCCAGWAKVDPKHSEWWKGPFLSESRQTMRLCSRKMPEEGSKKVHKSLKCWLLQWHNINQHIMTCMSIHMINNNNSYSFI